MIETGAIFQKVLTRMSESHWPYWRVETIGIRIGSIDHVRIRRVDEVNTTQIVSIAAISDPKRWLRCVSGDISGCPNYSVSEHKRVGRMVESAKEIQF